MDCASKRITQGHRILNPKQVRREILIPSLPFHIRAKLRETLRMNAAYTASKTPNARFPSRTHARLPPFETSTYSPATPSPFRPMLSAQFHPKSLFQIDS